MKKRIIKLRDTSGKNEQLAHVSTEPIIYNYGQVPIIETSMKKKKKMKQK